MIVLTTMVVGYVQNPKRPHRTITLTEKEIYVSTDVMLHIYNAQAAAAKTTERAIAMVLTIEIEMKEPAPD
jgi:hypothetical protein